MSRKAGPPPPFTEEMFIQCNKLIYDTAFKYDIPPVWITAHVRVKAADLARQEVMRAMITEVGMMRSQVARLMKRDYRRVRKSVLGV